jgi:DNA processing protein
MNTVSEECRCLIALGLVEGLGPVTIKRLLELAGGAEKIFSMKNSEFGEIPYFPMKLAGKIRSSMDSDSHKKEMEYVEGEGIGVMCLADEEYPEMLKHIYDPPAVIYYKGVMPEKGETCFAIVGSRKCSLYGMRVAENFSAGIASSGVTIISGMARGIDASAHRGALKAAGRTIAVMGTGFRNLYPEGSEKTVRDICRAGAVITEFPSGTMPSKSTFPRRNRIISGMSSGVLVVEAAKRSGALITVDFALEQGKDIFAVPGPVDSLTSSGTHALIQNGAKLVTSEKDILEDILPETVLSGNVTVEGLTPGEDPRGEGMVNVPGSWDVSPEQGKVLEFIPGGRSTHIDEISVHSGIGIRDIHKVLVSLELNGRIRSLPGAMYERSSSDSRRRAKNMDNAAQRGEKQAGMIL